MADLATYADLATAGGTLVLAVATFASVRAGARSTRIAEESLLAAIRPLLVPSRLDDPVQKVHFVDEHWVSLPGGAATAEVGDDAIYLTMSLRNAGTGLALLHGWRLYTERRTADAGPTPLPEFHRLTRDLYIPAGDIGYWQGALRDPSTSEYDEVCRAVRAHQTMTVDLLYGDHMGGQRSIVRMAYLPRGDDGWIATSSRYWNVDRDDPRR